MDLILKTAIVLGALSGLLALALTYSKKILEQDGQVTIGINQCEKVEVATHQSLLDALGFEGVSIPAKCGGKGTCGDCVVKFESPIPEANVFDKNCISASDLAAGYRLSCRHELMKDINISLPEDQVGHWVPCSVQSIEVRAHKLVEVNLIYDRLLPFEPGQRIRLKLTKANGMGTCIRSFYLTGAKHGDQVSRISLVETDYPEAMSVLRSHMKDIHPFKVELPLNDLQDNQVVICDRATIGLYLALGQSQRRKIILLESMETLEGVEANDVVILKTDALDQVVVNLIETDRLSSRDQIYLTGRGAWVMNFKKGLLRQGIPSKQIKTVFFKE